VAYQNNPPASGNHWPCWATYSIHTAALAPEIWVHNLEHGGIVLLYQCADGVSCPDAGAALSQVYANAPDAPTGGHRVLVTPDPTLPTPFAAVAWDWVYSAQKVDEIAMLCFASEHEGKGPEDNPSPGSPTCQ